MHTAKYPEVEASYKNCHADIYFKTKTVVAQVPTALSLSLMLSFYRTNVEPIDQVKSNLS